MRTAAYLAIPISLALTFSSIACDLIAVDQKTGEPLPFPTLYESIATSRVAFVGTVSGFRTDDTQLLTMTPSDLIVSVVSVVFDVEHGIKGIEAGRPYEEYCEASDGTAVRSSRWASATWGQMVSSVSRNSLPIQLKSNSRAGVQWRPEARARKYLEMPDRTTCPKCGSAEYTQRNYKLITGPGHAGRLGIPS